MSGERVATAFVKTAKISWVANFCFRATTARQSCARKSAADLAPRSSSGMCATRSVDLIADTSALRYAGARQGTAQEGQGTHERDQDAARPSDWKGMP